MKCSVGIATRGGLPLSPLFEALARQDVTPATVVVATTAPPLDTDLARADALGLSVRVITTNAEGYSINRNAVLDAACAEDLTHLAWIDDDEVPDPAWLAELVRVGDEYDSAIVLGPVRRRWSADAPHWARRANLPARAEYGEGPCNDPGRTGNCLFALRAASLDGLRFDLALNLSGGEDVDMIRRAKARGATVSWAPRAVVHEDATPEMSTIRWYLRRAWRTGSVSGASTGRIDPKRAPKALLLGLTGALTLRGDLLLRACWEAVFLAGQIRGRFVG